jgi:sugar-specific transcriptional regulator TrmB
MEQELMNYGLSEKEAKLYILCLKTGEASANRLIELSGIPRGTVYDILGKLKSKGLLSSIIKEKTSYFLANDPKILIKTLDEKKTEIQKILPDLNKLNKTIPKSITIEILEGSSGIKKVLDDVLEDCSQVIIMGSEMNAREIIKHHPQNFRINRIKNKIKIKNILEESKIARQLKNDKYSEIRYTKELLDSKEVIIIYNDITAHILMHSPITTIKITSKEYTKTQKMLFENMWKLASK